MARVGTEVHCFTCTCRACKRALTAHLVQCWKCEFRVHGECTTDGVCTLCSGMRFWWECYSAEAAQIQSKLALVKVLASI